MNENKNDMFGYQSAEGEPGEPKENFEQKQEPNPQAYVYTPNTAYGSYSVPAPGREKKSGVGIATVVVCILLAALIGAGTSFFIALNVFQSDAVKGNASSTPSESAPQTSVTSTVINVQGNVESLVEAVYQKAGDSVVGIRATTSIQGFLGSQDSSSDGSGVIYTADGYIITNYHVIENVAKSSSTKSIVEVYLNSDPETPIKADIVGYNISADLAVIKINKTGLSPVEIADSDALKVGQYAVAIGCPGGIEFMGSVSYGIISGVNRTITIDSIGDMKLIQTDAAINPGNSGGALLNSTGQLIGINSSKLVDESFEGMGFAIPSKTVIEVVSKIMDNKDKPTPYIGIEIYTYSGAYLEQYNLPRGAAVKSVVINGPAAAAGIRAGDIITEFNSVTVKEYTDFINALNDCTPGKKVTVKGYRNGRTYTTTVTVGSNNGY